jgi:protein-S-isoprenylcysteine O-methyltransferase Ste14
VKTVQTSQQRLAELIYHHRGKVAVALFAAVLACLAWGRTVLDLGDPLEDWLDLAGGAIVLTGHALRLLALRHIGPNSRTHDLGAATLVTQGPYAIVRNPLYLGNWLIAVGLCFFAQLSWLFVVGPAVVFALYYTAIRAEEGFLRERFGAGYRAYCAATPRLFPRALLSRRGWQLLTAKGTQPVWRTKEYQAFLNTSALILLTELTEALHKIGLRL